MRSALFRLFRRPRQPALTWGLAVCDDVAVHVRSTVLTMLLFDEVADRVRFDSAVVSPQGQQCLFCGGAAGCPDGRRIALTCWLPECLLEQPRFWTGLLLYEWSDCGCADPVRVPWPFRNLRPANAVWNSEGIQILCLHAVGDNFAPGAIVSYDPTSDTFQQETIEPGDSYVVRDVETLGLQEIDGRLVLLNLNSRRAFFIDSGTQLDYGHGDKQCIIGPSTGGQSVLLHRKDRRNWGLSRLREDGSRELLRNLKGAGGLELAHIAVTSNNVTVAVDNYEDTWMGLPNELTWLRLALDHSDAALSAITWKVVRQRGM
ncbi:MAG: hypothetical protein JXL80_11330 [Planctomycetes bacterium]|nr:hypothetical protein [Planctomycetota bacterium]